MGLLPYTKTTTKALTIYFSLLLPSKLLNSICLFMTRFTKRVILLNTSLFHVLVLCALQDRFFSLLLRRSCFLDGYPKSSSVSQFGLNLSQNLSHLNLQRFASHACCTDDHCNTVGGLGVLLHDIFTLRSRLRKQPMSRTLQVALAKEKNISQSFCTSKLHFLAWKCNMSLWSSSLARTSQMAPSN